MTAQKSIGNQLQLFALAQLDRAMTYLTDAKHDPDAAIHETRRCLKRVRADLRLVKSELTATTYDRNNVYLRNIGRRLAALRDVAVMRETVASLKKKYPHQLPDSMWRELEQELSTAHRQSAQQKKSRLIAVALRLRTARARVAQWALDFDDDVVLQKGIRKAYKQGRRALQQALKEPTPENFHEWRKQVNHLRHQLQILQTLKLGKVKTTLLQCKALAEVLGRKNDLAVLLHHWQSKHRQALETLTHAPDAALAAEAIKLGQQLYERKPKAFIRQISLAYLT